MKLNELADRPGATKNHKRVGRGIGSGSGKTGGRGGKGQTARTGVPRPAAIITPSQRTVPARRSPKREVRRPGVGQASLPRIAANGLLPSAGNCWAAAARRNSRSSRSSAACSRCNRCKLGALALLEPHDLALLLRQPCIDARDAEHHRFDACDLLSARPTEKGMVGP